jgi:hypothetical protein
MATVEIPHKILQGINQRRQDIDRSGAKMFSGLMKKSELEARSFDHFIC